MKKISLDGIEVLAGLEWTILDSGKTHKKALAEYMANNKGLRHGIVMTSHGESAVGRMPAGEKFKKGKTPSAAALLALANQRQLEAMGSSLDTENPGTITDSNWIVAQPIEGDSELYWMGAVRNGLPTPGSDFIGTLDEVTERIETLLHIGNFIIYSRSKEIRYNFSAMTSVIEKQFAELVAGIPPHKAEIKMFSLAGYLTMGILVGFVLLVGGWWGFTTWQEKVQQEKARIEAQRAADAQTKQAAEEVKKYEQDVRAVIIKSLDEGMAEVDAGLSSSSPLATMVAWRDLIYNMDVYQSTWDIQGVNCGVENQTPVCTISLQRGETGNNRQLLLEHPDAVIDGDSASYAVRGPDLQTRDVNSSHVTSALDFQKGLLSELQVLRQASITHQVAASQDIVKNVELPPPPSVLPAAAVEAVEGAPAVQSISINLGFASGELNISGEGLWQVSGLGKYLDQPNVRVTEFSTTISAGNLEKMTWNLKAAYFIRNLPQPVIPEVPLGDKKIVVEVPAKYHSTIEVTGGISESNVQGVTSVDDLLGSENGPLSTNPVPIPSN